MGYPDVDSRSMEIQELPLQEDSRTIELQSYNNSPGQDNRKIAEEYLTLSHLRHAHQYQQQQEQEQEQQQEQLDDNVDNRPPASSVKLKLISCCSSFLIAGLNDGSIGPLVPYFIEHYGISTGLVGVIYGASFAGWLAAAILMSFATVYCGLRGTLSAGALLYLLAQVLRVWIPPYPLFAISFFFAALGQAFQDSQANTFVSSIASSHLWLGVLHAMYGLGLLIAPLIATATASHDPRRWSFYYLLPMGVGVVNIVLLLASFYSLPFFRITADPEAAVPVAAAAAAAHSAERPQTGKFRAAIDEMKETVRVKEVWLISLFFFFYLGAGLTISGWLVVYLNQVRHLPLSSAGYVPTGYTAGLFIGRLLLPHPTHNWLGGEHYTLTILCIASLALQLLAWLVHSGIVTAVAWSLMGFCNGPFFAAAIQVASEVVPRKVRSSGLGLIFVMAQLGGSILPAVTGAVATEKGVEVMQPMALALIAAMGLSWWFVPTLKR